MYNSDCICEVKGELWNNESIEHFEQFRLLLSIDRRQSIDEAMDTVLLAEKYSTMPSCGEDQVKVVGIDLSGDPRVSGL